MNVNTLIDLFQQTDSTITIFGNQKHEGISESIVVTIATTTDRSTLSVIAPVH